MGNRRLFGLFILVLTILPFSLAYQTTLKEVGFTSLSNKDPFSTKCTTIDLTVPQADRNEFGSGLFSVQAEFVDLQEDSSYLVISINDGPDKVIWPESFSCNNGCWTRIFIPELKSGTVKVKLCAALGGLTKEVNITENSFFGIYDTPILTITNTAPEIVQLGDKAKMSIKVSNEGTKAANIFVQFVHPDVRAKIKVTSFDIVEGESSATTTIAPGETKYFDYYVKPTIISTYNMSSAALFFTNYFNEQQSIISNHPMMSVVKQDKVEISLVSLDEKNPYIFKAIIKNNSLSAFTGAIVVSPQTTLQSPVQEIFVAASSEKEITFVSKDIPEGEYSFFATVRDGNNVYTSNSIDLEVKNDGVPFDIVFALIGIIVGVSIFVWIYFIREK